MGFPPLSLYLLPLFFFFFLLPFFSSWLCPVLTSWVQFHFLCNSETCGRREEPMWTSSLIRTHFHPLWPTQHPSLTFVLTLLSFLAPFVHLFRERVKGHWVGPSPLHKKSPSSTRILGKTKTEKKIDAQKGSHCQNFVIGSLLIYLEHLALHITTKPNKPLVQPVEASLTLQWKLNLCL